NALNKIGLKSMSTSFVASQLTQDGKAPAERTVATERAKAGTPVGAVSALANGVQIDAAHLSHWHLGMTAHP
ncbi:MAG: hypothetical protein K2X55_13525, partial [Burkholderiaceae bacterium]|nr:hypothetical protein [Burkholderiaceae bacterium]